VPAATAADFVADNLHITQTLTFAQASSAVTPALDSPVLEIYADSLAGISLAAQTLVGTTATWMETDEGIEGCPSCIRRTNDIG
jgi:hypothetical protein